MIEHLKEKKQNGGFNPEKPQFLTEEALLVTPALPTWYEAYKFGNIHHPQTAFGIITFVGEQISRSLEAREVDLYYASCAQLTEDQMQDLAEHAVQAHHAHGITKMPSRFTYEGETVFDENEWFNNNWIDAKTGFVRSLAFYAAEMHPADMQKLIDQVPIEIQNSRNDPTQRMWREYKKKSTANHLAATIMRVKDNLEFNPYRKVVAEFQETSSYQEALPIVSEIFQNAVTTLTGEEAKELARRRRDQYSARKELKEDDEVGFTADDYEWQLFKLIEERLLTFTQEAAIPTEQVYNFLNVISTFPKWELKRILQYTIPETRRSQKVQSY